MALHVKKDMPKTVIKIFNMHRMPTEYILQQIWTICSLADMNT